MAFLRRFLNDAVGDDRPIKKKETFKPMDGGHRRAGCTPFTKEDESEVPWFLPDNLQRG